MGYTVYLAIALAGITILLVTATPTLVTKKCTASDPRENLFPECMQSKELVLWCDYSSYRSVPDPNEIDEAKSYNDSIALYLNDSCLPALHRYEIGKYPNIEDLNCGKNFIKELKGNLFLGNKKLRMVNFCTNLIKSIHSYAFYGLNKLEILNLTNNRISSISNRNMFRGLTSLKELSLEGNHIQVLPSRAFVHMTKLEVLVLRGNKISHIEELAFYRMRNLVRLHLDGNELSTLDAATFQSTPKLKVLTLSYNKFSVAPTFTKSSLPNLHTLNLGHNLLRELDISRVANLSKLQNLSLENNSIPVVSEDSFHHMPNLRFVNLSSNGIEEINQCSFSQSCHLEVLNLSNNTLKTPYPEWFTMLIRNNAIGGTDISGNQWKCDCNAIRFHEFLMDLPDSWKNELAITCDWPKEHFGKNLSDVIHSLKIDLNCKTEQYNKIERSCNTSMPPLQKATEVYTYLPTTTQEDTAEYTDYIVVKDNEPSDEFGVKDAIQSPKFGANEAIKSHNESLNLYLLIALCGACVIVVSLMIFLIKILRRKRICKGEKSESTDSMISPHRHTSRSDSEYSCERTRLSSATTVTTLQSRSSLGCQTDGHSCETTPLQPQDDLQRDSSKCSDSGITSYPSSVTSSEVVLSIDSNPSSNRSTLQVISEREEFETTPKTVLNSDQDPFEDQNEEFLMIGPREQPIGGNDGSETR